MALLLGALELLDNLSHASAGLAAAGVAAFRGLPPQLSEQREVVEGLLQSEMLGAALYGEAGGVLDRAIAEVGGGGGGVCRVSRRRGGGGGGG